MVRTTRTICMRYYLKLMTQKSGFWRKLIFWQTAMSKISENWFFGEKNPCGVVPQQNKSCKHVPEQSRPNSDQIISKNIFQINFIEHRRFSIKIAKDLKIVAKAKLEMGPASSSRSILFIWGAWCFQGMTWAIASCCTAVVEVELVGRRLPAWRFPGDDCLYQAVCTSYIGIWTAQSQFWSNMVHPYIYICKFSKG